MSTTVYKMEQSFTQCFIFNVIYFIFIIKINSSLFLIGYFVSNRAK